MRSVKFFVLSNFELKFTSAAAIVVALCGFSVTNDEPKSKALMPSENMKIMNSMNNKSKDQNSNNNIPSREFVTNAGVDLAKLYGAVMSNDLVLSEESCNQPSLGQKVDAIELEKNFQGPKIYTVSNEKYKAKKIPNRAILAMTSSSGVIESNWLDVEKNEKKSIATQANDKSDTIAKIENDEVKDAISALSDLSARRRNVALKDGPIIKRSLATDPIPDESSYTSSKRIMDLASSGLNNIISPPAGDGKSSTATSSTAKNVEPIKTQESQTAVDGSLKTATLQSPEGSPVKVTQEPLSSNNSSNVGTTSPNVQTSASQEKTTQSPAVNMVVHSDMGHNHASVNNIQPSNIKDPTYYSNSDSNSQIANFETNNNKVVRIARNYNYENKPGLDLLYPSGKVGNRGPSYENTVSWRDAPIDNTNAAERVLKLSETKKVAANVAIASDSIDSSPDNNAANQKFTPDLKQGNNSNAIDSIKVIKKQLQDQKGKPIVEKEKFGW